MKCVENSSTSLDKASLIHMYSSNPSYTRDIADQRGGVHEGSERLETRGDVLIQGILEHQTDAIIDVKLGYSDVDTYRFDPMDKILDHWDKQNKDKHGKNCHNQ